MTQAKNILKPGISIVINTFNEEQNIERAIKSALWADEILVCDLYSEDRTVLLAKDMGAKVFYHKRVEYVEPVRNFAISKAKNNWIFILDADEEIPECLAKRLQEIASDIKQIDYVRIPRRNIIFDKWMKASGWWPDYNIRFFRKGKVKWTDKIHRPPDTEGDGIDLPVQEEFAIIHHHYKSIDQFLERMIRYTKIQSQELKNDGYEFRWDDLIRKPLGEFLSRFFVNKGYADGLHGLVLSLLQAFSFLLLYLRIWETQKFMQKDIDLKELKENFSQSSKEIDYWLNFSNLSKNSFKRFFQKLKNKV